MYSGRTIMESFAKAPPLITSWLFFVVYMSSDHSTHRIFRNPNRYYIIPFCCCKEIEYLFRVICYCPRKVDAIANELTASHERSLVVFLLHRSSLSECACIICYVPVALTSTPGPGRLEKVMFSIPLFSAGG